jgi:hypothetical protein
VVSGSRVAVVAELHEVAAGAALDPRAIIGGTVSAPSANAGAREPN